jgi:hypothetical protein
MATTAKSIVPDGKDKDRKPLSKAHKAKLAAAPKEWHDGLTVGDVAGLLRRPGGFGRNRL